MVGCGCCGKKDPFTLHAGVRQGGRLGRQEEVHYVRRKRHQQQVDPHGRPLLLLEALRTEGRRGGYPGETARLGEKVAL